MHDEMIDLGLTNEMRPHVGGSVYGDYTTALDVSATFGLPYVINYASSPGTV